VGGHGFDGRVPTVAAEEGGSRPLTRGASAEAVAEIGDRVGGASRSSGGAGPSRPSLGSPVGSWWRGDRRVPPAAPSRRRTWARAEGSRACSEPGACGRNGRPARPNRSRW